MRAEWQVMLASSSPVPAYSTQHCEVGIADRHDWPLNKVDDTVLPAAVKEPHALCLD